MDATDSCRSQGITENTNVKTCAVDILLLLLFYFKKINRLSEVPGKAQSKPKQKHKHSLHTTVINIRINQVIFTSIYL